MRTARAHQPANQEAADGRLVLDYDARQKSRFKAVLDGGEELAVMLPRGTVLADGDRLLTDDGATIEVIASDEDLSIASTDDALLLTRAAYHLGNRHVPLRISSNSVAYRHDHVLDLMMRRLGLIVAFRRAPFTPEPGVYGHSPSGGHEHRHSHAEDEHSHHDHDRPAHEHSHGERHDR